MFFGYYVFGKDCKNIDLKTLQKYGVTDLFVNFYSYSLLGKSGLESWISKCGEYNINVHLWVQTYYNDGVWSNPLTFKNKNKLDEIKEYLKVKGLKGIHLDYLRYTGNAYKYNGGVDAITKLVKEVKNILPTGVSLSCAVMGEKEDKYYYGQDIKALAKIVDFIVPMTYKGNYQGDSTWLKNITQYFTSNASIWSGLQSYKSDDNPVQLSASELTSDIKIVKGQGAKGVVLFRYGLCPSINFKNITSTSTSTSSTNSSGGVSYTVITKIAESVKKYVEENKKFPSTVTIDKTKYNYGEIAYLLSSSVVSIGKSVSSVSVKNNTSSTGNTMNIKIVKNDYLDLAKRIRDYCKTYKTCPNYATSNSKQLRPRDYIYALARIIVYYNNHKQVYPNYVSVNTNSFK